MRFDIKRGGVIEFEDAIAIITGLTMAVGKAIMEDWPLKPAQPGVE